VGLGRCPAGTRGIWPGPHDANLFASGGCQLRVLLAAARVAANRQNIPRQIAGMVADALEGLQNERRFQRNLEVSRVFHRPSEQAAQAGGVFSIELLVARDDLSRERRLQPVECVECAAKQTDRKLSQVLCFSRGCGAWI
jgi:hypothetical protein